MSLLNETTWIEINVKGENTKHDYHGRFKLKAFLTHRERADAVRLSEKYNRGISDDLNYIGFQRLLAFLKFYIIEVDASWWKDDGQELFDEAPVYELVKELRKLQGAEDIAVEETKEEVKE